jgi:N-acetylneuraminic acid mutarotase
MLRYLKFGAAQALFCLLFRYLVRRSMKVNVARTMNKPMSGIGMVVAVLAFVSLGGAVLQGQSESTDTTIIHNTWTSGTAMLTPRMGAAAGMIGGKIYVIDGYNNSSIVGVNEIYNPTRKTWTTGSSDPNPRTFVSYAVVNKILYIFGGSNGSEILDLTESFNPATDTWTTLAPMPYPQQGASAVVDKDVIYLIGGRQISGDSLTNVASYNTLTNIWTEEPPVSVEKYYSAAGLLGASVVAADGLNGSDYIGDNEGYSATKNVWSELAADPTPRVAACWGAIAGKLYAVAGNDNNGDLLTLTESYTGTTKSWTTLAPVPVGIWFAAASAVSGGKLYCFGGGRYQQSVNDNVQIYQP